MPRPGRWSIVPDSSDWYDVWIVGRGEPVAALALDWRKGEGSVFLHLEVAYWSPMVFREFQSDLLGVVELAKVNGCKKIVAMTTNVDDPKWDKFLMKYGFNQPIGLRISALEV